MPCAIAYPKAVAVALDQLINAILGGWPDETLSSRAWRWSVSGRALWPRRVIDAMFFWDHDGPRRHCQLSFESECLGRQLPLAARGTPPPRKGHAALSPRPPATPAKTFSQEKIPWAV